MILPPHPTPADKRAAFDALVTAMLLAFRALEVSDLERTLIAARVAGEMGR